MTGAFNYKDYVDLSHVSPEEMRGNIEQAIVQMAQTPEFQEILRNAKKNNNGARIKVSTQNGVRTGHEDGLINISNQVFRNRYKGTDGRYHDSSLQRILFHEFFHSADDKLRHFKDLDPNKQAQLIKKRIEGVILNYYKEKTNNPNLTQEQATKMLDNESDFEAIEEIKDRIKESNPGEKRAITATNKFMKDKYGETPRSSYTDYDKAGTPALDMHNKIHLPSI